MRFFGQSIEYWMSQDAHLISQMIGVLESLSSREILDLITASNFSEMKKEERTKIWSRLNKKAYQTEQKPINLSELSKLIGARDGR
jgi:hypothetical protein